MTDWMLAVAVVHSVVVDFSGLFAVEILLHALLVQSSAPSFFVQTVRLSDRVRSLSEG